MLNSNFQPNPGVRTITLFSKIEILFIRSKSETCQLPPFRSWTSSGLYMACVGPQEGVKFQFSAKSKGAHHYTFLKNQNLPYKVNNQKIANCHHFVRGPASGLHMACVGPQESVKFQFSAKSKGALHYTFLKNQNLPYKVKIRKLPIATISFVDQL